MNKQIRKSKFTKVLACYLALMIFLQVTAPFQAYALTEGPSQPEFNSFTPIGTSDMVDLTSGDFNYNIPIMDVGGYPINLAYNSGVTMDQEASWVGLGWNLNVGQINRNVRGLPDDFRGDIVETENNMKTNFTVGINPYLNAQIVGLLDNPNMGLNIGAGLDVQYNNYTGFRAVPSYGATFQFNSFVSTGMQLSSSVEDGVSVTPSVTLSAKVDGAKLAQSFSATLSPSITYNSRQGLQSFNLSSGISGKSDKNHSQLRMQGGSGSISFLNNTFTPIKRLAFKNNNVRFSFSTGIDLWGGHGEVSVAGYGSVQKLIDTKQLQQAYGYQNTDYSNQYSLLDFNREKEQGSVSKSTLVLPVTNYTYDIYSIQGQGIGGTFRPFRGQTGYVFDPKVVDQSSSNSFSFEGEAGAGAHIGTNFRNTTSTSFTGKWEDAGVTPFLKEKKNGNLPDYESIYFKSLGENIADEQKGMNYASVLKNSKAITLKLDMNKDAINVYREKYQPNVESLLTDGTSFNTNKIKRENRELRNQVVQKVSKGEAKKYGLQSLINYNTVVVPNPQNPNLPKSLVPDHHTAGYVITGENGSRHIYGETIYNKEKKEVAFNIGNPGGIKLDMKTGQAIYGLTDNTTSNSNGRDNYFNSVKTPAYAHTFLLTAVLSPDYSDLTDNGPSDDDLGSYTKFVYKNHGDYKWRVPYGKINQSVSENVASYNEGLKTDTKDQKGSYLYGIKENKYLKRIETKTHVAFIDLERRDDGAGVSGENGGGSLSSIPNLLNKSNQMYRIKSIRLYAKPEAIRGNLFSDRQIIDYSKVAPIKTAHFEYDYSLCQGIDNNFKTEAGQKGKLTLKKVYFTYGNSNMGKFAPYRFDYKQTETDVQTGAKYNPDYNIKGYDIWGNFKDYNPNSAPISSNFTTPQEFPYVDQTNREFQNVNAASWSLQAIDLPSGGRIEVEFEADDYKFVQDKKAMQMFKVEGVTNNPSLNTFTDQLYNGLTIYDAKYVVIKVEQYVKSGLNSNLNALARKEALIKKYTEGLKDKPIYFNFLLNMTGTSYDYVSGYFEMDGAALLSADENHLFIPMKFLNVEGKSTTNTNLSNPISVAGWFFGRQNLNREVYGSMADPQGTVLNNIEDIGISIVDNLGELINIFNGANTVLRNKGCAKTFKPKKSWIRLNEPTGSKIGGGCRVKKVVLKDQWDKMLDVTTNLDRYAKQYGQEYDYDLEDGTSSGVATYEPNISKENPLIIPFYHKKERLTEQSYQEKPFGESFFPSPTVTYSRVSVRNVNANNTKSTTGKVVTQHFTSYDFPTRTDFTNLDKSKQFYSNEDQAIGNMLKGMLSMNVETQADLTMTQGFVIETNDMNGKVKKQEVFNNNDGVISSVEYKYSTQEKDVANQIVKDERILENKLPVVREDGTISKVELGTQYDVVNDMRESYSEVNSSGAAANVDFVPFLPLSIILGWASVENSTHKQILRTAVTTKVVHKTGILKEKIAFDLGSMVYTKNLAWDAKTGQVLLTETVNEFDDRYYSFNFPAYWNYKQMGMTSQNIDFEGVINMTPVVESVQGVNQQFFTVSGITGTDIRKYFQEGDEIGMYQGTRKFWVAGFNSSNTAMRLINANGQTIPGFIDVAGFNTKFKILRSGFRNNQMASMASITLMRNPITTDGLSSTLYKNNINTSFLKTSVDPDPKIINASAVEYEDFWEAQCENGLRLSTTTINKYLYNIKGLWRPIRSYAYLTGRNANSSSNIRNSGYFTTFNPFYVIQSSAWKRADNYASYWTYASEVTKFNPYGVEVENKDALNRFSSAQYGYKYKLPVAVASNSPYKEMGFDGFEDYEFNNWENPILLRPHFGFNEYIDLSQGSSISKEKSHTGKKSLLLNPGTNITITRELQPCD